MNNGINSDGRDLRTEYEKNSASAERIALLVLVGLAIEIAGALIFEKSWLEASITIIATALIAIGVWGEIIFGRRAKEAGDGIVAEANARAAEANERAANADLARVELETRLAPRELTQEQFEALQELKGKYDTINVAYETDAETRWFATSIVSALFAAEIKVGHFRRAADVHSFGAMIYEPGASASSLRDGVLMGIFRKAAIFKGAVKLISKLPLDIPAPLDAPLIVVGGRFILPPSRSNTHISAPKAANDAATE
jgi:hypothetical protein